MTGLAWFWLAFGMFWFVMFVVSFAVTMRGWGRALDGWDYANDRWSAFGDAYFELAMAALPIVDDEACRIDHDGNCIEHVGDNPCSMVRLRELVLAAGDSSNPLFDGDLDDD